MPIKRNLLSLSMALLLVSSASVTADDLAALAGKWSVKKTNDQGQNYTQTIELKKDKFVFEILSADDQVVLHAEGEVKLEKLGPFSSVRFYHIRSGQSSTDLRDIDDEYVSVYVLDSDTWTNASNFDKPRDQQKPGVDVYRRVKTAPADKPAK